MEGGIERGARVVGVGGRLGCRYGREGQAGMGGGAALGDCLVDGVEACWRVWGGGNGTARMVY
ncbi:hypothetical protein B1218_35755 [Pseudomonas ogarae]|nr:hypothetical protein B1218_35755 [Pseudomonas ogarae]